MGHEVRLLALEDGDAALLFPVQEVVGMNTRSFFDRKAARKLAAFIKEWQPDVVQANAGDTVRLAVSSRLLYRWNVPVVMRNASTISRYLNSRYKKWYYRFLVKQVDAVASVSQVSYRDFSQTFPGAAGKIHLLPVGIDPAAFIQSQPYKEHSPYILHVGGFTFEKNHQGLLRIYELVARHCPDTKLLCAGDGPLFREVEQTIREKQLADRVILLGQRTDVPSLIKGTQALVLPSIIEGLPSVILEAMYCGVPTVAYDTGGIAQLLTPATGWLIPAGNEQAFADSVVTLLTNNMNGVQERLQNAKQLVETSYTMEEVARQFEILYRRLAF